ncbi:MAG: MFS transporter [Pseudomonadota bacterium]
MAEGAGRIYYGWYVVAAAFVVMLTGFAAAYSFSAFFPALQHEFEASRASVSLVFSVGGALYFWVGAISGPLSDRFGPKWVCLFGFCALGGGLVAAAFAPNLAVVYLGFGLGIGIGVGFTYVPAVGAVQPWFLRRRGFASGLAVSGIGVGTLVGPLIASALIATVGWRDTFVALGLGAAVIGAMASLILQNDPSRRPGGLRDEATGTAAAVVSTGLRDALRTRPFVLLYASAACLSFALFVPFVHLVPYALDHGFTVATGALVLGLVGVGSTVGRFLVGSVADRFGRLDVYVCCFGGVAMTFFVWLLASELVLLGVFAFVFGTFYGGFVALAPSVTVDYFGPKSAASIIGFLYSSVGIGTLLGPPFAGFVFDRLGGYDYAIVAGQYAAIIATGLAMLLPDPKRWNAE